MKDSRGARNVMMRRTFIPAAIAILVTGVAILGVGAILYHTVFFYKADGVMSPETAARAGLVRDDGTRFSSELAFKKGEAGFYYRERRATAFIDRTNYTGIDLATECKRLGGCKWQGQQESR